MNRVDTIKRLRELADKLESATNWPHDGHDGFDLALRLHSHYLAQKSQRADVCTRWIDLFGLTERTQDGSTVWYGLPGDYKSSVDTHVYCDCDYYYGGLLLDLLAGRDVQLVEIGGAL